MLNHEYAMYDACKNNPERVLMFAINRSASELEIIEM